MGWRRENFKKISFRVERHFRYCSERRQKKVTTAAAHDIELSCQRRRPGPFRSWRRCFYLQLTDPQSNSRRGSCFMKINGLPPPLDASDTGQNRTDRGIPFAPFRTKRLRGVFIDFHRARCANVATSWNHLTVIWRLFNIIIVGARNKGSAAEQPEHWCYSIYCRQRKHFFFSLLTGASAKTSPPQRNLHLFLSRWSRKSFDKEQNNLTAENRIINLIHGLVGFAWTMWAAPWASDNLSLLRKRNRWLWKYCIASWRHDTSHDKGAPRRKRCSPG